MLTFVTSDSVKVYCDEEIAKNLQVISNLLSDLENAGTEDIPILIVDSVTLKYIIEY